MGSMRLLPFILSCLTLALCFSFTSQTVIAQDAAKRVETPIYELLKFRPKYDTHLSEIQEDLVLVQVNAVGNRDKAIAFLELHSTFSFIGIKVKKATGDFEYRILLGVYDDLDSARWAIEDFLREHPSFRADQIKRVPLKDIRAQIVS